MMARKPAEKVRGITYRKNL